MSVKAEDCQFSAGFHQACEVVTADPNLMPLFSPGKANATVLAFAR